MVFTATGSLHDLEVHRLNLYDHILLTMQQPSSFRLEALAKSCGITAWQLITGPTGESDGDSGCTTLGIRPTAKDGPLEL